MNYKILTVKTLKADYYIPLVLIDDEWKHLYMPNGEPSSSNFKKSNMNPDYLFFQIKELINYGCTSFKEAKQRLVNYILNYENTVVSTEEVLFTREDLIQ